jgi:hypothetical protein
MGQKKHIEYVTRKISKVEWFSNIQKLKSRENVLAPKAFVMLF